MQVVIEPERLRLREPLVTAWGTLTERELLRVTVVDRDGLAGYGEAAPLEPYDGVPLVTVRAALDAYAAVLAAAAPGAAPDELIAACRAERDLPAALAAVDLALWDLEGRRAGAPVHALLHPRDGVPSAVAVNATIGATDPAAAARAAADAWDAGFGTVKVKVGLGDPVERIADVARARLSGPGGLRGPGTFGGGTVPAGDVARVAAVRAAAPDVAIRVDANGAWATPAEALERLRALAPYGIELAEEPVHGVPALRAVRADSPVPIAMDETGAEPGASSAGAADAVCLKISRSGGILGLLREAREARAAGALVYVASTFDGPLGIAAGLHAAATLAADGPVAACGLATLAAFEGEPALRVRGGAMQTPLKPGLGV